MAKRALFANNAGKLQGKTVRQIADIPGSATDLNGLVEEDIAAMPGPASTASALVTVASAPFALAPGEQRDFSAQCPGNAKAISGGFTSVDNVLAADTSDVYGRWLDALADQPVGLVQRDRKRPRRLPRSKRRRTAARPRAGT
jgi:hypothetical protein